MILSKLYNGVTFDSHSGNVTMPILLMLIVIWFHSMGDMSYYARHDADDVGMYYGSSNGPSRSS